MEYIISLSSQAKAFLLSVGFGALLGILYDIIRIIRLTFTKSVTALYVSDVLFVVLSAFASFLFTLAVTDGEARLFILLGEVTGFFIYYFTFGVIAVHYTEAAADRIKEFFIKVFRIIFAPFRRLFRFLKKKANSFSQFLSKKSKKAGKIMKFRLQSKAALLYNITDKMHIFSKSSVNGESENQYEPEDKEKNN